MNEWQEIKVVRMPDIDAINNAAKTVAATAGKWGHVADVFMSWNTPIVFAMGVAIGVFIFAILRSAK